MTKTLYQRTAIGTLDEVGIRLEKACASHKFGIIGIVDIREKMRNKGLVFGPACKIYEVCNPQKAKEILENDLRISTALPCRIAVYEKDGRVELSTIRPSIMLNLFDAAGLMDIAEEVEETIQAIIDDTAGQPASA